MKQLFILLSLSFVLSVGYAQEKRDSLVTGSNVEKLIDKYSAKFSASIVSLAQSLKTPAEHVYKVLVRQQVITAFRYLLVCILLLGVSLTFLTVGYRKWNKAIAQLDPNDRYRTANFDDGPWSFLVTAGYVALVVFLVAFCGSLGEIITGFFNPEFGAISDIAKFF